ncbi:Lrp/AsnC ligand binding domain-containing protein [Candidatus Bathyarchaeota archaeon]|nr:Lrp/AsnC ligand binding domain-containing protein [Candidatus Bathyarchaeota archaeon]
MWLQGLLFGSHSFTAKYGVYDVIAKVQAEDMSKLKEAITVKIRALDTIRSTLTMIVIS